MKIVACKYFLIVFLFLLNFNSAFPDVVKPNHNTKKFKSVICIMVGLPYATESEDFFKHYVSILAGAKREFKPYPIFAFGTKFQFWNKIRLGIASELFYAQLNDPFIQEVKTIDDKGIRSITEKFDISSIPLFITVESIPLEQQFRTYFGLGLGIVFTNMKWEEILSSTFPFDKRQGGIHYEGTYIFPAFRIYSGLELGLDKYMIKNFVQSIVIEAKFTYFVRSINIFKEIAYQFDEKPKNIYDSVTILPGYIGLYIGLNFNFDRG